MKRHIISQPAIKDLEEIINYFSNRNIKAGEKFINEFEKNVSTWLIFLKWGAIMTILNLLCEDCL